MTGEFTKLIELMLDELSNELEFKHYRVDGALYRTINIITKSYMNIATIEIHDNGGFRIQCYYYKSRIDSPYYDYDLTTYFTNIASPTTIDDMRTQLGLALKSHVEFVKNTTWRSDISDKDAADMYADLTIEQINKDADKLTG